MSIKIERIEKEMVREVSQILQTEVKNTALKFITITACHVTNDLSFAKIYFTCFQEEERKEVEVALKQATGFIRKQLADRMNVRHTPELTFVYDDSIAYGKKIESVIEKMHEGEANEEK